jgi:predicted  nucleic acid-binding Zn-ribbon protein
MEKDSVIEEKVKELSGATQRILLLEQRMEDVQSQLTTETADNVKLRQENAALQTTVVSTNRLISEYDERIRANGSKLEHGTKQLQSAMDEIIQLQSNLSTALEDIKAAKYFRSEAEVAFAALEAELDSANERIRLLTSQFETRIGFLQSNIAKLQRVIHQKSKAVRELTADVQSAVDPNQELQISYDAAEQTLFNNALPLDMLESLLQNPRAMGDGDEFNAQKVVISIESGTAHPYDLYHLFQILVPFAGTPIYAASLKRLAKEMLKYRGTAVEVMRAVRSGGFDERVADWVPAESLDEPLPFPENIITWVDMWLFRLSAAAQIVLPPFINMTMSLKCSFDEVVLEKMMDMCIKLFPLEINGNERHVWFAEGELGWWGMDGEICGIAINEICEGIAMVNGSIVEFGDGLHAVLAASQIEIQDR